VKDILRGDVEFTERGPAPGDRCYFLTVISVFDEREVSLPPFGRRKCDVRGLV
jgi:hypothetical protein